VLLQPIKFRSGDRTGEFPKHALGGIKSRCGLRQQGQVSRSQPPELSTLKLKKILRKGGDVFNLG
jgi:hypothetical protein